MDNEILKRLYEQYGKELYLYILSMCRNRAVAEDIIQETFLKAIFALDERHSNMRAWLYMVARNLCINYLKKVGRETSVDNDKTTENDFVHTLIENERKAALYKVLGRLSYTKREIISLHYFGGLQLNEIAGILKLSRENVRVLNHRAKNELRRYLEEEDL